MMSDPRTALTSDPRPPCDPRTMLSVCTCGLPNCPRVPHHPTTHPMTLAQEGHLAATHGLSGLPIGSPPVGHVDPALLYQMGAAYGLPESPDVMRALPQLGGYYPYDPSSVYPYMNGYAGIDARRKNATKESTNTLKAWLFEHRKNPYPTKGEKIMLAILTKMTLTQVSTWFANARRRLKKENKVTWVTKDDVIGDDDEDDDADSERNSDVGDHVTGGGGAGGDGAAAGDNMRHHGSVGDEDDNMSVLSAGDRSEIDVEENSEVGDDVEPDVGRGTADVTGPLPAAVYAGKPSQSACSTTSARTDNSDQSQRENDNSTTREANASPITPPPSPRTSQSTCSSQTTPTSVHQSTATIHHHPVTSANSTPMSSKPKIWSIADVVSSKEASDRTETRPEVTSAACRPLAFGPSKCIGAPSAIVSIGGAPVRQYGCTESPYSFAYYPYTLPHTAMMTSQAAAVAASHVRLAAHPYSMPAHAHSSPSATHLISPASGLERPLSGQSAFVRATAQLTPSVGGTNDSTKATENNNKQASQGQADTKCSTSVFMPVTQRQV